MASRADVDRLAAANDQLIQMMVEELNQLRGALGDDPATIRDALLDTMPAMVKRYGDLAAVVSAEWFEEVYGVSAQTASGVSVAQVQAGVRYAAGHAFAGDPMSVYATLLQGLDKWVKQQGRETIRNSAFSHKMAYARVPRGGKSCAFCLMLASRGAVYQSRRTAGGLGREFHGQCRCQVIAYRDGDDWPSGYDPDALLDVYNAAREHAGSGDPNEIAKAMRQLEPDLVRDAHKR